MGAEGSRIDAGFGSATDWMRWHHSDPTPLVWAYARPPRNAKAYHRRALTSAWTSERAGYNPVLTGSKLSC